MNEDSTRVSPGGGRTPPPTPGPRPAPAPVSMPARIGPYAIERELGRGGMGVVYKALRADLRRVFALKTLLSQGGAVPPEALDRFVREARAAAALAGHPNVVAVHDAGRDGETYFIAMDFVDGPSLASLIAKEGVTTKRALAIAEDVANALHAAHELGLVHRDVKPANVLIDPRGTPRLTDFGLVGAADERADGGRLTEAGSILGTPAYMAPEQAAGETDRIGPRTDVYGAGALLYEMLTGTPPFKGSSGFALMKQVMFDDPVPPRRKNPAVPRDVEAVCLKALEKEPERRYASARALAEDLARARQGLPTLARPLGPVRRAGRWVRRHKALVAVSAVALSTIVHLAVAIPDAILRAALREARTALTEQDGERAFSLYAALVAAYPRNAEAIAGLESAADSLAAEASVHHEWDAVVAVGNRLLAAGKGVPRLVERAERMRRLDLGTGWLRLSAAEDLEHADERTTARMYVYDERRGTLLKLERPGKDSRRIELKEGEHRLVFARTHDEAIAIEETKRLLQEPTRRNSEVYVDELSFEIGWGQEVMIDLAARKVAPGDGTLAAALAEAKPGNVIRLEPGVYRDNALVLRDHIRIVGPVPASDIHDGSYMTSVVLDGGGAGAALAISARDVRVKNVALARGRPHALVVEDSAHVWLDNVTIVSATEEGAAIARTRALRGTLLRFRDAEPFECELPKGGLIATDVVNAALVDVRTPRPIGGAAIALERCIGVNVRGHARKPHQFPLRADVGVRILGGAQLLVSGIHTRAKKDGLVVGGGADVTVVSGCHFSESGTNGASVAASGRTLFVRTIFEKNAGAGLETFVPADVPSQVSIEECAFVENGQAIRVSRGAPPAIRESWTRRDRTASAPGLGLLDAEPPIAADEGGPPAIRRPSPWDFLHFSPLPAVFYQVHFQDPFKEGGPGPVDAKRLRYEPKEGRGAREEIFTTSASPYDRTEKLIRHPFLRDLQDAATMRGRIAGGRLVLDGSSDAESGPITGVPMRHHSVDSIQTITIRADAKAPEGVAAHDALALEWRFDEVGGRSIPWQPISVADLGTGTWVRGFHVPGLRAPSFQLRWPSASAGGRPRAATVSLSAIDHEVEAIDARCRIPTAHFDARLLSVHAPAHVRAGETFEVELLYRNTGEAPWTSALGLGLESVGGRTDDVNDTAPELTFPPRTRTFRFSLTAPRTKGPWSVAWRPRVRGPVLGGKLVFGEVAALTVHVEPSAR